MSSINKFNIIIPPQDIACEPGCLQRFSHGDRQAFAWLYKNYSRKVFDYVKLMTGNESLSEDLVQEVFIKLWIHREKLATVENFNGYLYRLQKNLVINSMKQQQTEMITRQKYFFESLIQVTRADELIERKELADILEKKISLLPLKQQQVYRLSSETGLRREQIAKLLNISPFTVKCHLQKARKFLRIKSD